MVFSSSVMLVCNAIVPNFLIGEKIKYAIIAVIKVSKKMATQPFFHLWIVGSFSKTIDFEIGLIGTDVSC